jgi:sugar phosphate permease
MEPMAPAREEDRSYYGWVLAWSLGFTELVSWGVLVYGFGVFLVPMRAELGWSTAELTGAYSLGIVVSALLAVPAGRWLDRRGPRALMTAGSVLTVLVLAAWSQVASLPAFYVLWAAAGVAMAATLYEPAFSVMAVWFARRRPSAMLVVTALGGLASVVFVPLSGVLASAYGWREALVMLAVLVAVTTVPAHALLLRAAPSADAVHEEEDAGNERRSRAVRHRLPAEALRSRSFRWLAACLFLVTVGRIAVVVHLVAYLTERGYTLTRAALAAGAVGILQVCGRLLATALRNVLPERFTYAGVFVAQGAAVLLLLASHGSGAGATVAVVAFVAIFGLGFGLPELLRATLVADFYGTERYASVNGVLALFVTGARALAPVAAGALRTFTGSYTVALAGAGLCVCASAAALLAAHRAHGAES